MVKMQNGCIYGTHAPTPLSGWYTCFITFATGKVDYPSHSLHKFIIPLSIMYQNNYLECSRPVAKVLKHAVTVSKSVQNHLMTHSVTRPQQSVLRLGWSNHAPLESGHNALCRLVDRVHSQSLCTKQYSVVQCRVFSPQSMHYPIVWCAVYIHFAPCSLSTNLQSAILDLTKKHISTLQ
jgi:hypothetical protein